MSEDFPSAAVRAWANERLGVEGTFHECTRRLAEARTWAVRVDDAPIGWLKWHRQPDKAAREARAYTVWLAGMRDVSAEFLGTCPAGRGWMLTRHVPGTPLDAMEMTDPERRAAYRNLGRTLARLHSVRAEGPQDPVPLHEALLSRARAWSARAQEAGGFAGLDAAQASLEAPWPTSLSRVPCHRDVQLHNVIGRRVDGRLVTVLIDFGQARPDVWMVDFVKLFQLPSALVPGAMEACLEGYGRKMDPVERRTFDRLRVLHGLGTWTWAVSHGDHGVARSARRVISDALHAMR